MCRRVVPTRMPATQPAFRRGIRFQAAAQRLHAGDTAILMDRERTRKAPDQFCEFGAASDPITLKAQNKWGAIVSSVSSQRSGLQRPPELHHDRGFADFGFA